MLRLALAAAVVTLSACASPMPATTADAALPSVEAGSNDVAVAQPVAPTGDDAADAFLAGLAAAIDRHDWRGVAERLDPEPLGVVFQTARASGDTPRNAAARGVARLLGLRDVAAGPAPFARLDGLRVVTLRSLAAMNDLPGVVYLVEGDVRMDDGTTMPLSLMLGRGADGDYRVGLPEAANAR